MSESVLSLSAHEGGGSGTGCSRQSSPASGCVVFWQWLGGDEKRLMKEGMRDKAVSFQQTQAIAPHIHTLNQGTRLSGPLFQTGAKS